MTRIDLGPYPNLPGYSTACELDSADPLAPFANRFVPLDPDLIYLDGNSLGRLTLAAQRSLDEVINIEWGQRLIRSWSDRWWELGDEIGAMVAPLVGASPRDVTWPTRHPLLCSSLP